MEMMPVRPERKVQLEAYAQQRGQSVVDALDDLLAAQLEWEQREYEETVQAALKGYADVQAELTRPAEEVYESLRLKHGF